MNLPGWFAFSASSMFCFQTVPAISGDMSAFTGGPKKLAEDAAIAQVAAKHRATPSQVALAWLLHRDERILLIPGTSSVAHLEENLAAADVELDADDMTALDDVQPADNPLEEVHD